MAFLNLRYSSNLSPMPPSMIMSTSACQRDARQQFVVGFPRNRENRQFLAGHQRIEQVDHGDVGAYHAARNDALGRVHGRSGNGIRFS